MKLYKHCILYLMSLLSGISFGNTTDDKLSVHLLSYLSQDYGEAVQNGKITSEEEYQEQIEFINEVERISKRRDYPEVISSKILYLKNGILKKKPVTLISDLASNIKEDIIRDFSLATAPTMKMDFGSARKIYTQACTQCHGSEGKGDGIAGANLEPKPTNFHDLERMQNISPFNAYNTITLGVNGTGMASYQHLSEQDRWSLAFYVSSFRYSKHKARSNKSINLDERSVLTDNELIDKYSIPESETISFLASVRDISQPTQQSGSARKHYISVAMEKLNESVRLYKSNQKAAANNAALSAYLEGIEPIEGYLKSKDENLVFSIERNMAALRKMLKESGDQNTVIGNKSKEILAQLDQAEKLSSASTDGYEGFILSFGIVIREALEAGLILFLLFSLLKKLNIGQLGRWVHGGWITAVLVGLIAYFVMETFFRISGLLVESVEAYVGLLAAGILLIVGIWFHRHSNIKKWKEELQTAIETSAMEGKKLTLFFIAFVAVFREIFETILFVKILAIDGYSPLSIGSGTFLAIAVATVIVVVAVKYSIRFNLGLIFKASTFLILVLAIVLFGKSIDAFQKIGALASTDTNIPSFTLFGFNSTAEVLTAQLILLVGIIGYFLLSKRIHSLTPKES